MGETSKIVLYRIISYRIRVSYRIVSYRGIVSYRNYLVNSFGEDYFISGIHLSKRRNLSLGDTIE